MREPGRQSRERRANGVPNVLSIVWPAIVLVRSVSVDMAGGLLQDERRTAIASHSIQAADQCEPAEQEWIINHGEEMRPSAESVASERACGAGRSGRRRPSRGRRTQRRRQAPTQ